VYSDDKDSIHKTVGINSRSIVKKIIWPKR